MSDSDKKLYESKLPTVEELEDYGFHPLYCDIARECGFPRYKTVLKPPDDYYTIKTTLEKPIIFINMLGNLLLDYIQRVLFNGKLRYVLDIIMTEIGPESLTILLDSMKIYKSSIDIDCYYNLLWYFSFAKYFVDVSAYEDTEMVRTFNTMLYYITALSREELLELLGEEEYNQSENPTDFASLVFAIFSFRSTYVDPKDIPRYEKVKYYPPNIVWILAYYLYGIIDEEKLKASVYPPYIFVALNDPDPVEDIILSINPLNVEEMAKIYKVRFPSKLSIKEKINYLCIELIKKRKYIHSTNPVIIFSNPISVEEKRIAKKIERRGYPSTIPETIKKKLHNFEPYETVTNLREFDFGSKSELDIEKNIESLTKRLFLYQKIKFRESKY
ncbi:MAG: hypothetical protein QW303_07565, partial [Nitrososphaerota archaeon]